MCVVLIVDDHHETGRLLARLLRGRGYEATVVHSGQEAINFVIAAPVTPGLVLLDVMMPELNGFDTLALLRQLPAGTELPVVMLTALEGDENVDRAMQLGALDYFLKSSFEPRRLLDLIGVHMRRESSPCLGSST